MTTQTRPLATFPTLRVPLALRRRPDPAPLDALWIETQQASDVLALAIRLRLEPFPTLYPIDGGCLVVLDAQPTTSGGFARVTPGATRLRAIAPAFFIPVDADLVPSLLDDEAAGLTRDLGRVMLPGDRLLTFEPGQPRALADLIAFNRVPERTWSAFAEPPRLADRLEMVTRIAVHREPSEADSPTMVEELKDGDDPLDNLGEEIGAEEPRPKESGPAANFVGKVTLKTGQGIQSLGKMLGMQGLAAFGASLMGKAMSIAPRLSEAVLGRQEGSLRELLKMFREGRIDDALRHALPLGSPGGRGGTASTDHKLPNRDPSYSLKTLLGDSDHRSGAGPSYWLGGEDVQAELLREYRKAADDALAHGDIRRAAYIHARLLNDYRTAAEILDRGGLHHDAAWIYLHKLSDPIRAARAFEAAGEIERALELYNQRGEHALAAELLRRAGDHEGALTQYLRAANDWATRPDGPGVLAAGDLLRDRAGRPDLALVYYGQGWAQRPSLNAVACALRMARLHADQGLLEPILTLVREADLYFTTIGREEETATFYHAIVELADLPALAEGRDELRDHALMGLAAKLRQAVGVRPHPGNLVSSLLGWSMGFPPELIQDATHAVQAAATERASLARLAGGFQGSGNARGLSHKPLRRFRIHEAGGLVTAFAASPLGDMFVGFANGDLVVLPHDRPGAESIYHAYQPPVVNPGEHLLLSESSRQGRHRGALQSIAVSESGRVVVALWSRGQIQPFSNLGGTQTFGPRNLLPSLETGEDGWLTPLLDEPDGNMLSLAVWNGQSLLLAPPSRSFLFPTFQPVPLDFCKMPPKIGLLLNRPNPNLARTTPLILVHDGPDWCLVDLEGKSPRRRYLGWEPALPDSSTLRATRLCSLVVDRGMIEIAGITATGAIHWSSLTIGDREFILSGKASTDDESGYQTLCLAKPGLVVGVTPNRVDWIQCDPRRVRTLATLELADHHVVACALNPRNRELLLITRDGEVIGFPMLA